MAECPKLNSFDSNPLIITADNQGELRLSSYNRTENTVVELSCEEGLKLVGDATVTCKSDLRWDFDTKPYCTGNGTTNGLSEETKILIGVLVGIAGLVVLVLAFILCIVMSKLKEKEKQEKLYEEETSEEISVKNNPGYWSEDFNYLKPSSTRDMSPGIYSVHLQKREFPYREPNDKNNFDNASLPPMKMYRGKSWSVETDYSWYGKSSNSPPLQDQASGPHSRPHNPNRKRPKRKNRTTSSEPPRKDIYVGNWPSRGSMKELNEFNRRALLHGRDPFLWKKVDTNWGIHLPKKDYVHDDVM